jgi:tyrosyl-tRNA synthetase
MDEIKRGVAEIIPEDALVKKIERSIAKNTPLIIKLGCDPSRPDLHLGHTVVLRKLRQFQDLGHTAILIIGDFTGMIGDPSGKNKTRPPLSLEETQRNGESYFSQAAKVLSQERIQIRYNSEWLNAMSFSDVITLTSKYTVSQMLERDDFHKRFNAEEPISVHELLYPLAQAMDSVAIRSDVELGGTDQKFNLLVGRDIQIAYGCTPQVIVTMPILAGTDGTHKMSKSLDNYIGISDTPKEMYGKTLSIPDTLLHEYFLLTTNVTAETLHTMETSMNPRDLKRLLARTLVAMYYDTTIAQTAENEFDAIFIKKEIPDNIEIFELTSTAAQATISTQTTIGELLVMTKLAQTKSEARRLLAQGGVSVDGEKVSDYNTLIPITDFIIKVGKRKFLKIIH